MSDIDTRLTAAYISPHFMSNALIAIRSLCQPYSDAYRAMTELSEFMRSSLDVLNETGPIPIEDELDTVEKYLDIQNIRFEDKITVDWDITDSDFKVPAFSVQLAVENAVIHGINKEGSILIGTYKTENGHKVIIKDDGKGFDPSTPEGIGIKTLKSRVDAMCSGSVDIKSGPGTTVTIYIPEEA